MKKMKNPEKISLIFFLMLLILLPVILTSNTEEKIILSKAEESSGATPSATLIPTMNISPFPTVYITPIIPTSLPTQQQTPSPTGIQPSPTLFPSPSLTATPSSAPSPIPSPVVPTLFPSTPVVIPTKPQEENTVITTDMTMPEKINSFTQSKFQSLILPSFSIENASGVIGNLTTLFDDVFGVYVASSQKDISINDVSVLSIDMEMYPTLNREEYTHIELREKDLSPGFFTRWLDKLFKKERTRMIAYAFILNPDGFVYTSSPIISIQASHGPFDELVDRKKTLAKIVINERNCFDRDGFDSCGNLHEYYVNYPDYHHRIHTLIVTSMTGTETNMNTLLTLDQWDGIGFSELRDEQGLSVSSIIRAQPDKVKSTYTDFDSATSSFTLNELYDVVRSFTTTITRDQLVRLLVRDDRVTLRIE